MQKPKVWRFYIAFGLLVVLAGASLTPEVSTRLVKVPQCRHVTTLYLFRMRGDLVPDEERFSYDSTDEESWLFIHEEMQSTASYHLGSSDASGPLIAGLILMWWGASLAMLLFFDRLTSGYRRPIAIITSGLMAILGTVLVLHATIL